jgi:hypothetical protein
MTYVNSLASVARGIKVEILIPEPGHTKQKIGEPLDDGIPIPQTSMDDIEVTNQDSGDWKEYKAGRKDGGECEIKCHAIAGDQGQIELAYASSNGSTAQFTVTFSDGSYLTFYGTVKTFDHIVEGQLLLISSKVKVSGEPIYSTSKSALTGLTVTGTLIPSSFSGTTYVYTTTIADTDTEAVIVAQAAAGATITVDGKTVASGDNGTITIGPIGTDVVRSVAVVVAEPSKAVTVYTVIIIRPK